MIAINDIFRRYSFEKQFLLFKNIVILQKL